MKKNYIACLTLSLTLAACGGAEEKKPAEPSLEPQQTLASHQIEAGNYYLSAANLEAFGTDGSKIDPQNLQVAGTYTWAVESLGSDRYRATATGSVKLSNSNQTVAELNCRGSQDVFTFEVTSSKAVRNFKMVEAGCPQGVSSVATRQLTIESFDKSTFSLTIVTQEDGWRVIEEYIFKK